VRLINRTTRHVALTGEKPNVLLLGREISCWTSNARAKCWREATDAIEMEVRRSGCA
jgi:hypothetical protein